jgi:hypothetical protein
VHVGKLSGGLGFSQNGFGATEAGRTRVERWERGTASIVEVQGRRSEDGNLYIKRW